jgi:hypothetical protein
MREPAASTVLIPGETMVGWMNSFDGTLIMFYIQEREEKALASRRYPSQVP